MLEVVVATVIFAIVVMGSSSMIVAARRQVNRIADRRTAMSLANGELERLMALDAEDDLNLDDSKVGTVYTYVPSGSTPGIVSFTGTQAFQVERNGRTFTLTCQGIVREASTSGGSSFDYYYMELVITVQWGPTNNESYQISALKA